MSGGVRVAPRTLTPEEIDCLVDGLVCFWQDGEKRHYGLPSRQGGWLTLVTVFSNGEVCLLGSLVVLRCATREQMTYWKRVSYLQVAPSSRNVLRAFWDRVPGIWKGALEV
ncbi:MAG: hypothetical protein AB1816_08120 [Bacillota bacterium]